MNLSFSELINDKVQYFLLKIWLSLDPELKSEDFKTYADAYRNKFGQPIGRPAGKLEEIAPKIHTIRRLRTTAADDLAPRQWKAGMAIHFSINPNQADYFRFAPLTRCISVQKIAIKWAKERNDLPSITIDQKALNSRQIALLALNDGFDSTAAFLNYFSDDFTGTLVHWTSQVY